MGLPGHPFAKVRDKEITSKFDSGPLLPCRGGPVVEGLPDFFKKKRFEGNFCPKEVAFLLQGWSKFVLVFFPAKKTL